MYKWAFIACEIVEVNVAASLPTLALFRAEQQSTTVIDVVASRRNISNIFNTSVSTSFENDVL
jgi:hypothetical protein